MKAILEHGIANKPESYRITFGFAHNLNVKNGGKK